MFCCYGMRRGEGFGGYDAADLDKIIDRLYVGSSKAARQLGALKRRSITHIINLYSPPDLDNEEKTEQPQYEHDGFKYLHVCVEDNRSILLLPFFDRCLAFIQNCLDQEENILVHCKIGASRSPCIVAAHLMKKHKMTKEEAVSLLYSRRGSVNINTGFLMQLEYYEKAACNVEEAQLSIKTDVKRSLEDVQQFIQKFEKKCSRGSELTPKQHQALFEQFTKLRRLTLLDDECSEIRSRLVNEIGKFFGDESIPDD